MSPRKNPLLRKAVVGAALAGAMSLAAVAQAAPGPKLQTFGNGDVVVTAADAATIVNDAGEYGGVYVSSKSNSSKALGSVVFQFRSTDDSAGGAPRFSLPVDTDGVGKTVEGYAFMDVAGCGGVSDVPTLVTTQSGDCHVNFQSVDYANWTTFAAAHPTYRMSPGAIPFIIADAAGSYSVDSIVLR